jgi:hypothetical protein
MSPSREELAEVFDGLSDQELERRAGTGVLTELAQEVAVEELGRRGLSLPEPPAPPPVAPPPAPEGDPRFVLLTSYFDAIEAQTLRARLEAEGIPAMLGAAQHSQAMSLLAPALGGVRVEVPLEYAQEARRLLAELNAGHLALEPEPEPEPDPAANPDPLFATNRRRLRTFVFDGMILFWAAFGLLVPLVRAVIVQYAHPEWGAISLWSFVAPTAYFIAALLFVVRSKWSLPIFMVHLVALPALHFMFPDLKYVIGGSIGSPLLTGLILYYGFQLLRDGKLR